jgi:transposase
MDTPLVFVGIDVAKAHLDLAVRPTGEAWQVANDPAGIAELVARLQALRPALIVVEATGGLEVPLTAAVAAAGLAIARHVAATGGPGVAGEPDAATVASIRRQAAKRVALRLHPTRSATWDHRKLAGAG